MSHSLQANSERQSSYTVKHSRYNLKSSEMNIQQLELGRSLSNLALLLKNQVGGYCAIYNPAMRIESHFLSQGKLEAAKPLYRRALAIHRKLYGNEHPAVAIDLNNLAMLLRLQV